MQTTVIEPPAPAAAPARRRPAIARVVFTAATAIALVHALDDAFLHRQPGVGLSQHALAALIAAAAAIGAIWAFPRMGPALRAATAFSFGVLAAVNGAMHVQHVRVDGMAGSDLSGVTAAAAVTARARRTPSAGTGGTTSTARWPS